MAWIELGFDFGRIFEHESFEPAFGRGAIETVIRYGGGRAAMEIELLNQAIEFWLIRLLKFFSRVAQTEGESISRPAHEFEAAKTKRRFTCARDGADRECVGRFRHRRSKRGDSRESAARNGKSGFHFAAPDEPAFEIAAVRKIQLLNAAIRLGVFEDFRVHGRGKAEHALAKAAARALWYKQAQAFHRAAVGMATCPIEPQNSERQNSFNRCSVFARRHREDRPRLRSFQHFPANVQAGE